MFTSLHEIRTAAESSVVEETAGHSLSLVHAGVSASAVALVAASGAAAAKRLEGISPYLLSWQKRAFDVVMALLILVIILPLMLQIAVIVRTTSAGPAIYKQKRSGRDNHQFEILKFRTMFQQDEPDTSGFLRQACRGDNRVTWAGRWLRRLSLDELPQFINVLRGEMSLVGPRPHALCHDHYYAQHVTDYIRRYSCRPGITGLAQAYGARGETQSHADMQRRIDLDLQYVANASFVADMTILSRTIAELFKWNDVY